MIDFLGAEVISASLKEMRKISYVMRTQQGKIVTSSAIGQLKFFQFIIKIPR